MNGLIYLAIFLIVAWLLLRLLLAVSSIFLNLIWIIGLILVAMWVWGKLFKR